MKNDPRPESLTDTDWGDIWENLPEAPPLVPRPKTTQITLRISPSAISRLRAVARIRALPYTPSPGHGSWTACDRLRLRW